MEIYFQSNWVKLDGLTKTEICRSEATEKGRSPEIEVIVRILSKKKIREMSPNRWKFISNLFGRNWLYVDISFGFL